MKITKVTTHLVNCGLRNYLFLQLHTDKGLVGLGEASLEWQERAVATLIEDWLTDRIIGVDPYDIERTFCHLTRDQYQGGSTVMTAISAAEIACWDLIGKDCGQPVYRLLGGQARDVFPAYANGWYGGAVTPADYAAKAKTALALGYRGLKFDPFGTAWKELPPAESDAAIAIMRAVREAAGDDIELFVEVHGRLSAPAAIDVVDRLTPYRPGWIEEPVTPNSLELLAYVKERVRFPVAAGERLYTLDDFARLAQLRACDIMQPDLAHCGGLSIGKKIAAHCQTQDIKLAPHCSIGPVALAAAWHFGWSTPQVMIQENFGEFDAPWRNRLVGGWNPVAKGQYLLPSKPGLGLELDLEQCAQHPYKHNPFPSLWDNRWISEFTKKDLPEE